MMSKKDDKKKNSKSVSSSNSDKLSKFGVWTVRASLIICMIFIISSTSAADLVIGLDDFDTNSSLSSNVKNISGNNSNINTSIKINDSNSKNNSVNDSNKNSSNKSDTKSKDDSNVKSTSNDLDDSNNKANVYGGGYEIVSYNSDNVVDTPSKTSVAGVQRDYNSSNLSNSDELASDESSDYYNITAVYGGDSNNSASSDSSVLEVVKNSNHTNGISKDVNMKSTGVQLIGIVISLFLIALTYRKK
ncbi:hypothetical protein [Methanobrevibacter filiformis]|nr:hypothetical protein [Methanobrevibacter filiformis]